MDFGFPNEDEMRIRLDYKNDFCVWEGKYAVAEDAILLFVTEFSESDGGGFEDGGGVMGYNDLSDYLELPEQIETDLWVDLPGKAKTAYREMEKEALLSIDDGDITEEAQKLYEAAQELVN